MLPRSKTPAPRSKCPVSCALDLIGDRWSLLVVRDLMRGKRRFAEFFESPEGIPTNILADRLKRMVEYGIATSTPYSEHPLRLEYSLTQKGEGLRAVIREMIEELDKEIAVRLKPYQQQVKLACTVPGI